MSRVTHILFQVLLLIVAMIWSGPVNGLRSFRSFSERDRYDCYLSLDEFFYCYLYLYLLIYSCDMAIRANYPFAYSKYSGQTVESKVLIIKYCEVLL